MNRTLLAALTGAALLLLVAGCGKSEQRVPRTAEAVAGEGINNGQAGAAANSNAGAAAAGADADSQGGGASAPGGVARVIYFDFDSSEIRPEFVSVISSHAHALARNASIRVRLEGHTDERGSPEYNIGLGERRAQAVRRALMLQGVTEAQVSTVSYGEERPAVTGQEEAAWAKNRRVEFVYQN
jgi:peptidoglycan-associated lipoprotein